MHPTDWICLAVLLGSLLLGAWRGLLYEALSVAGWVAAYFVARWAADWVGQALPMGEAPAEWRFAAGFVLVFIVVAFGGGMLAWAVRGAARALGMRPVDRVLGAVFGALRGVLLLLVLAVVVQVTGQGQAPWWRESASGAWLQGMLGQLHPVLPAALVQRIGEIGGA
ncbi:CvpA family protein [Ottowia pentelensis]|mgnify:FL=1|uniref:CvpA family protein n=1 Tax=Ottowia pentelensis TaxID=511108 RepID=A0ABV6PUM6_9BURK|nr:CvpA family protein [Ottowia sp.]MBS0400892.1 CvpA family protein [Pseudomonadota bacterium]HMN57075.1 CvpA family protein [Ottowia sp.]